MSDPPGWAYRDPGIFKAIGALGLLGAAIGIMCGVLHNDGLGMLGIFSMFGALVGAFIALAILTINSPKPRFLFVVCCALPADEGRELWELMVSTLHETQDARKRLRYILDFFCNAPLFFYHGWMYQLNGSLRRVRR